MKIQNNQLWANFILFLGCSKLGSFTVFSIHFETKGKILYSLLDNNIEFDGDLYENNFQVEPHLKGTIKWCNFIETYILF